MCDPILVTVVYLGVLSILCFILHVFLYIHMLIWYYRKFVAYLAVK